MEELYRLKTGLAEMLKGGVIMDVTTPEQAKIAENAGAVATGGRCSAKSRRPRAAQARTSWISSTSAGPVSRRCRPP